MSAPTDLTERYGAPAPWRRRALIGVCAVVGAALLGWLGWVIWDQTKPQVRSDLVGFEVVDDHHATATVDVRLADDGVVASCTLRASSSDHTVVGELVFVPSDGQSKQDVRTERRATSVELLGCTAPGQDHPR